MAITAVEAAVRLDALIDQVNDDQEAVEITTAHGAAYLVPADEYESLRETAYLLRSKRNAQRLRGSMSEVRADGPAPRIVKPGDAYRRKVISPRSW